MTNIKRNYRKQSVHLAIARSTLEVLNKTGNKTLQGRKSAESNVRNWRLSHPGGIKADCIRDTGLDKKTVYKWWNKGFEPEKSTHQIVADWREQYPDKTKAACIRDTGLDKKTVYKWWDKPIIQHEQQEEQLFEVDLGNGKIEKWTQKQIDDFNKSHWHKNLPEHYVVEGSSDMLQRMMDYASSGVRSVEILSQAEYEYLIKKQNKN